MLSPVPAGKGSMFIRLPQIHVRVRRLREVAEALCREVNRWKGQDGPLTPQECRRYLDGVPDATRGLDDARDALAKALARLDKIEGPTYPPL
jgi:hypothetical protein